MSFAYTPHVARKPLRPVKPSPSSSNHRRIPSGTPAKTPAKTPGRAAARTPALPTFREEDNDVAARLAQFEFRMVRTEMELDDLDRRKASIGPTPQASSARPAHAPALEPPLAAPEQLAAAEQLAAQLKEQLAASEQEAATLKPQLAAEQQAHATAQQLLNGQQRDAATTMQLAAAEQRLCATEQQLRAAKEELTAAKEQLAATRQRLHAEQGHVAELETSKASMNAALLLASEIMAEQRQTIAEVKGGLQIVARVHTPMVTPSDGEPPTPPEPKVEVEMLSTGGANITVSQASILRPGEAVKFQLDSAFPPGSTQSSLFKELEPAVRQSMGTSISIFAYGQTGSGKTFTMMGKGVARIVASSHELSNTFSMRWASWRRGAYA